MKNLSFVLMCLLGTMIMSNTAQAQLGFEDDFESYTIPAGPVGDFGSPWLVGANVFNPDGSFAYNYFAFPAPSFTGSFSNIVTDGTNQTLEVFSDYNNGDHATLTIEAFIFQNFTIGTADLGETFEYSFDHENINADPSLGNVERVVGYLRVLTPDFSTVVFNQEVDIATPLTTSALSVVVDPAWDGYNFQVGFINESTGFGPTAVRIDNVVLRLVPEVVPTMGEWGVICLSISMVIFGVVAIRREDYVIA